MTLLSERYRVDDAVYGDAAISVHRGHDQVLNRGVTIEVLKPGPVDASIAAALRDKARRMAVTELPNVAALYDQGEENGRPYLVFEELQGAPLAEIAPLAPDEVVTLVAALNATLRAAKNAQAPLPHLDGSSVRFVDSRTQIVDWGIAPDSGPSADDPATVGQLLALAATGSPTGEGGRPAPAPIMRIINRAQTGQYASTLVLEDELRAATSTADDPTIAIPRARPTMVLPREEKRPARAPGPAKAAQRLTRVPAETARGARSPRWLLPVGAGLLLLLGLLAGARWLRNTSMTSTQAAATPAATVGAAQPTTGAPAQGKPYVVATRDGQRLNVRNGPGTRNPVVGVVTNGTVVRVIEGPVAGGGFNWVHIRGGGVDGWAVLEALRQQ